MIATFLPTATTSAPPPRRTQITSRASSRFTTSHTTYHRTCHTTSHKATFATIDIRASRHDRNSIETNGLRRIGRCVCGNAVWHCCRGRAGRSAGARYRRQAQAVDSSRVFPRRKEISSCHHYHGVVVAHVARPLGDAARLSDIRELLHERGAQVDDALRNSLRHIAEAPSALRAAVEYGLLGPGKRLRPLLVGFAAEAVGGNADAAMPAACAVEMVHAYSLIHDDLPAMDDDDLRRGRPTVHKKFGEALAILAGDALLTLAFQVLANESPPATSAACCSELAAAAGAVGMIGGQVSDLTWDGKIAGEPGPASVETLAAMHAAKTGALFRASLQLGLLSAQSERPGGPEPNKRAALDEYGRCFGLAFQITDDLLDVEGQTAVAGKQVGKDAARGKLTYPRLLGIDESRRRADELARRANEALSPLGPGADPLKELMRMIVTRDH
jgi:geranylgeranyl diphosphate synthase type II